jgi:pyridoxine 5-phosphate synthase
VVTVPLRLGVNIDHVATLRNARGGHHPDPVRAAELAIAAGADGITAHLREDRRHIRDDDIARLRARIGKPLNLEMAATAEMVAIALRTLPHAACIVPEKREERTTEGGLDVAGQFDQILPVVQKLKAAGIRVSLFIAPEPAQIEMAAKAGAPVIEIHTGTWCDAVDYVTAEAVAALPEIVELNIGHYVMGEAVFSGLGDVVRKMRAAMDRGRRSAGKAP